jgi:hypothetical protein
MTVHEYGADCFLASCSRRRGSSSRGGQEGLRALQIWHLGIAVPWCLLDSNIFAPARTEPLPLSSRTYLGAASSISQPGLDRHSLRSAHCMQDASFGAVSTAVADRVDWLLYSRGTYYGGCSVRGSHAVWSLLW